MTQPMGGQNVAGRSITTKGVLVRGTIPLNSIVSIFYSETITFYIFYIKYVNIRTYIGDTSPGTLL